VKAVILAGGEGTRLRPLTSNQAKPMMPLVNKPMMEHVVGLLAQHGFDDVVVTVAYLANQIRTYFGDGSDFGVRMRYATDEEPLGTAGSVRNAAAELEDTFLVISGDVLTDLDLTAFVKAHRDSGAVASIALKRVENPLEFGIVITRPDGSIERFLEKPSWGQVFSDTINTGIYVLEPVIFDAIQSARAKGIDVVLADTAGRLPTQLHLMDEIRKVKRVMAKADVAAPHETWLVIDANTGQNVVRQVKAFDEALGLTGLILTKLDGTAKGGAVAAIAREHPVAIRFIGIGEKADDLRAFAAADFVEALFA